MKKLFLLFAATTLLLANVGKIITLKGDAIIVHNSQERAAKINDIVEENDKVVTKSNSKLQIKFVDNTIVTLGKNTKLDIKNYVINGKKSKVQLGVNEGSFKVISGNISKIARENFEFQAKTATIGIRGTVFVGSLGKVDKIGCMQGAIDVKVGQKMQRINAGKQMQFYNQKITKIEKIIPKDYEEVAALKAKKMQAKEQRLQLNQDIRNQKMENILEKKQYNMEKRQMHQQNMNQFLEKKQQMIDAKKDYYQNKYKKQEEFRNAQKIGADGRQWKQARHCGNGQTCGIYIKDGVSYKSYFDKTKNKIIEEKLNK